MRSWYVNGPDCMRNTSTPKWPPNCPSGIGNLLLCGTFKLQLKTWVSGPRKLIPHGFGSGCRFHKHRAINVYAPQRRASFQLIRYHIEFNSLERFPSLPLCSLIFSSLLLFSLPFFSLPFFSLLLIPKKGQTLKAKQTHWLQNLRSRWVFSSLSFSSLPFPFVCFPFPSFHLPSVIFHCLPFFSLPFCSLPFPYLLFPSLLFLLFSEFPFPPLLFHFLVSPSLLFHSLVFFSLPFS